MRKPLTAKEIAHNRERAAVRRSERHRLGRLNFVYKFDLERMKALCAHITAGASVPAACKALRMSWKTVYHWIGTEKEAAAMYDAAVEARADIRAEEVVLIADQSKEHKLRIEARKWDASRRKPHKYGDKVEVKGGGVSLIQLLVLSRELAPEMVKRGEIPALPGRVKS